MASLRQYGGETHDYTRYQARLSNGIQMSNVIYISPKANVTHREPIDPNRPVDSRMQAFPATRRSAEPDEAGALQALVGELEHRLEAVTAAIDDPVAKAALIEKASVLVQHMMALHWAFARLVAARVAEASDSAKQGPGNLVCGTEA